jgi:superfamily II DNA or RNA helicase
MTTTLKLRDYQETCIEKILAAFERGINRPGIVLPTGSGKTVIFAYLVTRWVKEHNGRVLILVHRDELVRQAVNKIKSVAPDLNVGVVKANENDIDAQVIVASVQTLSRERRMVQVENVSLIIVDEAHHAAARSYQDILRWFGSFETLPTVGFTATMIRGDNKKLGDVWQEVVFTRDILWMITHGYLVDVKGYSVEVEDLELDAVSRSRGDYQEGSLGMALLNSSAGQQVADAYEEYTPGQSAILFAPTVQSAQMFADVFNDRGIPTETVFGTTTMEERSGIYRRAQSGDTSVLANNMVLTEGFDMPRISAILGCRPTQNIGLYIQMSGRALRPYPGKDYATILDTTGVAREHSLRGIIDLAQSKKAKDIEEGQTLTKAAALWDAEPTWDDTESDASELNLSEVDLFQRSHSMWLQTPGGIWFVNTASHFYVLWPLASGDFRVIKTRQDNVRQASKLSEDLPLDYAMAVAEGCLADEDPMLSSKTASWRKRKAAATNAQISYALGLGIESPEVYTKSQLSDMISSVKAGRVLDPLFEAKRR